MKKKFKGLEQAVVQENEMRRVSAIILEHVKTVSKAFIGKKIETQTGLSSKYYDALNMLQFRDLKVNPVPGGTYANTHHISVKTDYTSVYVEISVCFDDPNRDGCFYDKNTYYFGKIENGILLSVNDLKVPAPDLDYFNELGAIMQYRKLEEQLQEAKKAINVGSEAYKYMSLEDF